MRQQLTGRERRDVALVLVHVVRLRRADVAIVCAALGGLLLSVGHTVPNLQDDPTIPPTQAPLLVAALLASTVVLMVRPVLPEPERLAARSMWAARAVLAGALIVLGSVTLAIGAFAIASHPVVSSLGTAAALVGTALFLAPAGTFAALSLPWLYVVSGLAFGYQTKIDRPASLRSWAWLVDPESAPLGWELATLALGLLAFVLVPPRSDRD